MCFPAKEVTVYAVRGFESHPLRHLDTPKFQPHGHTAYNAVLNKRL